MDENEEEKKEIQNKLNLIDDLINDMNEKVSYHVNISEHTKEIKKLTQQIRDCF